MTTAKLELESNLSIIRRPQTALEANLFAPNRILSEMTLNLLAVAEETAPTRIDLDLLVRKGKLIQLKKGDIQEDIEAFRLFYQAAFAGHSEAQYLISECYASGYGVRTDDDLAEIHWLMWLRKSAESGFSLAQREVAVLYSGCWSLRSFGFQFTASDIETDNEKAAQWFQKAAMQGDSLSQGLLGNSYATGNGVPQDGSKAVYWYIKAAEQGVSAFQFHLACCYRDGKWIPQDYSEAARWYRKAAEQGNAQAQNMLGILYENGAGVSEDYDLAIRWYRKAAELGNAESQYRIGTDYHVSRRSEIQSDLRYAIAWYQLAADNGYELAVGKAQELTKYLTPTELQGARAFYRELKEKHSPRV